MININNMSDREIIISLRYCTSDNGEFCDLCPYEQFGQACSKILLKDASLRLAELTGKEGNN